MTLSAPINDIKWPLQLATWYSNGSLVWRLYYRTQQWNSLRRDWREATTAVYSNLNMVCKSRPLRHNAGKLQGEGARVKIATGRKFTILRIEIAENTESEGVSNFISKMRPVQTAHVRHRRQIPPPLRNEGDSHSTFHPRLQRPPGEGYSRSSWMYTLLQDTIMWKNTDTNQQT